MQHKKRDIQPPAPQDGEAVKPEPPDDLWNQIEAALVVAERTKNKPSGSFTAAELADHKGLTRSQAARRIAKLLVSGKVKKCGVSNGTYYVLVKP